MIGTPEELEKSIASEMAKRSKVIKFGGPPGAAPVGAVQGRKERVQGNALQ
jgi:hypothetical protein